MQSAHIDEELAACCQPYLLPDNKPVVPTQARFQGSGKDWPATDALARLTVWTLNLGRLECEVLPAQGKA